MTELRTSDENHGRSQQATCPVCDKLVSAVQQVDGSGRLIAKYRYGLHVGGSHSFGRHCKGSGELTVGIIQ